MIPDNITRKQVLYAIEEAKRTGIPEKRKSKKFLLKFENGYFPPKFVISLANKYANGERLNPAEFSGGKESNDFLRALGFEIFENKLLKKAAPMPQHELQKNLSQVHHIERCPNCKQTIEKLLEKIYGKVERSYKFKVGTHPNDYLDNAQYNKLKEIYDALQNFRGFGEFIKAKTLPNCDFFIPDLGLIVEFDESQHFSSPRKIALERYPNELGLGFNRAKWVASCNRINAQDNNPPYRDEQRAWYDTLRDFLPAVKGLKPTIRLLAGDFVWCSLNPENASDVERFEKLMRDDSDLWKIEAKGKEEPNPFFSRIIIADEWDGNPRKARSLLEEICGKWPNHKKVKFLITCGGFVQFGWPKLISRTDIGDNKYPNEEVLNALVAEAEKCAKFVLDEELSNKLRQFTDYVTLGIDTRKDKVSTTRNFIGQPHVELVFLIDLRNNKFYWTGKSYPTPAQQKGLVRISKLEKHFFELDIGTVMILGCHDLAIFNPRSKNAKYWRYQTNREFKLLATTKKPVCVLHHPHTTVIRKTWLTSWNSLIRKLPSVEHYAGAGRYYEAYRNRSKWDALEIVLAATKCGGSIDFVVCK